MLLQVAAEALQTMQEIVPVLRPALPAPVPAKLQVCWDTALHALQASLFVTLCTNCLMPAHLIHSAACQGPT